MYDCNTDTETPTMSHFSCKSMMGRHNGLDLNRLQENKK